MSRFDGPSMNERRPTAVSKVEALTRLDVAVDNLLTASILLYEQDLLTEAQYEAIHRVLDLLDPKALTALRIAVGHEAPEYILSDLRWEMEHDLKFRKVVKDGKVVEVT